MGETILTINNATAIFKGEIHINKISNYSMLEEPRHFLRSHLFTKHIFVSLTLYYILCDSGCLLPAVGATQKQHS
jgi:hypothetical protein